MPNINELSKRELETLHLVAKGKSNKEIAQELTISVNTVKVHLRNIFVKLEVSSRTEATLIAIQEGLVEVNNVDAAQTTLDASLPEDVQLSPDERPASIFKQKISQTWLQRYRWVLPGFAFLLIGGLIFGVWATFLNPPSPAVTESPAVKQTGWQTLVPMPTARQGLAVAAYENQIYAIAGENSNGPVGNVERYNPATNEWIELLPKPTAVTNISAAVIGGRIFVPGGRLISGAVSNVFEIYDPRQNTWEQGVPLPVALDAYALVAFEGQLYLFGGWDGQRYLNSVYTFDPGQDKWTTLTPMPLKRGYAGAIVTGGKIFVIGGYDGEQAITANLTYLPEHEQAGEDPWIEAAPMEEGRYAMGIASVPDSIHIIGGEVETGDLPPQLEYFLQRDEWEIRENPVSETWSHLGAILLETKLYAFGGQLNGNPTQRSLSYQAIYTVVIPVVR